MYAEDVDLCLRVKAAGWRTCYVGGAVVIHHGGQSSRKEQNNFADVLMRESRMRLLRTWRGRGYAAAYRAVTGAAAICRLAMLAGAMRLLLPARSRARGLRLRRKSGPTFSAGPSGWNPGLPGWLPRRSAHEPQQVVLGHGQHDVRGLRWAWARPS